MTAFHIFIYYILQGVHGGVLFHYHNLMFSRSERETQRMKEKKEHFVPILLSFSVAIVFFLRGYTMSLHSLNEYLYIKAG